MANIRNFKPVEYVYFVFAQGTSAGRGFSTYTDSVGALGRPGTPVMVTYQTDKNKNPIPYHFSFSVRDRVLRVEKDKVDANGMSVVEFLRNSPECKDSPNGNYSTDGVQFNVVFKEMNEEADADKALKAKEFRRNAENIAADLSLEDVFEINSLLGIFKQGEVMSRHALLEIAGNRPDVFMDAYENPQRKALSLVRRAIDKKVLHYQGGTVIWNKTTLGLDEQDAATTLQKEPKIYEALDLAVKKVS